MAELVNAAMSSKAWPFQEARQLLKRIERSNTDKDFVIFQTGFGPSGLPHIGTFGEVARTTMVQQAFETLSARPTKLICFSDDMDGFRKVPEDVPDRDRMKEDLNLPLCRVHDPFGTHESFAAHNNDRLCSFLDRFGFNYEFLSAATCYRQGRFDDILQRVLERFDHVMEIMLPSLGAVTEGRKNTYSPFLPISPKTGHVLQVPTLERNVTRGTIVYEEPDGERIEVPVTGGQVKLQWKPDWAMRWVALAVDYEMYGKDLIPSAELCTKICRALGGHPPAGMAYELFLDASGRKISKSKGTAGVTVDTWLRYASPESLAAFMFQKPKTAKRLFAEIIPKSVDDYHQHLRAFPSQEDTARLNNPVWHVHRGHPPESTLTVPYSMLLNLASATSATREEVLWGFIRKYNPEASPQKNPDLVAAAQGAVRYFQEEMLPKRQFVSPNERQWAAITELQLRIWFWSGAAEAEKIQSVIYAVGRRHHFDDMKEWFSILYQVLFGSSQGPRMGGFVEIFGTAETARLIEERLTAVPLVRPVVRSDFNLFVLLLLAHQDGLASFADIRNGMTDLWSSRLIVNAQQQSSRIDSARVIEQFIAELNDEDALCGRNFVETVENVEGLRITPAGKEFIDLE